MLIPLSWIKDYVDLTQAPEQIAAALTLAGLEVDKIHAQNLGFTGIVAGKVIKTIPHPEADRLKVATVTDGKEEFQVVCGAPNCREGLKTAFAKVGASLTDPEKGPWKIKQSKLRGVESNGMLCSQKELNLSSEHEGIIELPQDTPIGISIDGLFSDPVFEISLTPNLGHCMSIKGVARELSTIFSLPLKKILHKLQESDQMPIQDFLIVSIESPELCSRYAARYIEGVQIGPSPDWLKKRLEQVGIRSINNVVDATNYVMMATGQPLHAFDYDYVEGSEIIVKTTSDGVLLETLDEHIRTLDPGTLCIFDREKPLALAGIMGGRSSSITQTTTRLVIEAAEFNSSHVRKTSKNLHLRTDSSSRFEKGIDACSIPDALDLACSIIQQTAGGYIAKGSIDLFSHAKGRFIKCRMERVNHLLGATLSLNEVDSILKRLHFTFELDAQKGIFTVKIPSFRNDLVEEIDLIEDVAKVYGYNNISSRESSYFSSNLRNSATYEIEKLTRSRLIAEGLQEFLTCDLISPKLATLGLKSLHHGQPSLLHVLHPSSIDQSILRPSLLPCLLESLKRNFDFQNFSVNAFEIGHIHLKTQEIIQESLHAGILLSGLKTPHFWGGVDQMVDFFDLKGMIENYLHHIRLEKITFSPSHLSGFHPKRQSMLFSSNQLVGILGEVHPDCLQELGIKQKVYFAEIDLSQIVSLKPTLPPMTPLPLFPGSERDWTASFKKESLAGKILSDMQAVNSRILKKIELLDVYENEKIGVDRKNLTFRFYYRDDQKTLEIEHIEKEHARILAMLKQKLEASLI